MHMLLARHKGYTNTYNSFYIFNPASTLYCTIQLFQKFICVVAAIVQELSSKLPTGESFLKLQIKRTG